MTPPRGPAPARIAPHQDPRRPVPRPVFRWLKAFAFDPSSGKNYGNYMTLQVPYEYPLTPGPVGHYIAVVDYDAPNQCYYEAVDLNDRWILANAGLSPSESDPRFHQQMVYAVVSETIQHFEFALGRRIHWRRDPKNSPFQSKLLVFPHGIQEANAFYDPNLHALVFGYFAASDTDPGKNLPGQMIFTCLSHDVVAHEATHALLDGIRPAFMEPTNQDVAAFHEGFADIVALFQHFNNSEAVLDALRDTGGALFRDKLRPVIKPGPDGVKITAELEQGNPLVALADQFGDAIGLHGPLRSAIGTAPDSKALETMTEPHDRGSILVAAIFDAFFSVFMRRTADLWRISGISRDAGDVNLHPDLLARLANEVSKAAGHFETICIRALDYAPAVDITFGDYLRALITADYDAVRDDDLGYRAALIDAFRSRGIRPENVFSYSEESLLWSPPETKHALKLVGLRRIDPNASEEERQSLNKANARLLQQFAVRNADTFGLDPSNSRHIAVESFHFMIRTNPDSRLPKSEMVAVILERQEPPKGRGIAPAVGGVTLLFEENGALRYAIRKSLKGDRAAKQAAFRHDLWESMPRGAYEEGQAGKIDFRALHQRY